MNYQAVSNLRETPRQEKNKRRFSGRALLIPKSSLHHQRSEVVSPLVFAIRHRNRFFDRFVFHLDHALIRNVVFKAFEALERRGQVCLLTVIPSDSPTS